MISSSFSLQPCPSLHFPSSTVTVPARSSHDIRRPQATTEQSVRFTNKFSAHHLFTVMSKPVLLQKSVVPFAASVSILLCSGPAAKAGFLSGFPGIESVPGPQLPSIEFLNRFNEENQKKYAEFDSRFKESPLLKKLLEQSRLNKEKNKQDILDKYCIRGAEWGVGDCSAEGMSPADRDNFISMLKQKAGMKD